MNPIRFAEQNNVARAPQGVPEGAVLDVDTFTDGDQCITCWQPTPEERAAIAAGGPVWLSVHFMGGRMPPVSLHGLTPFIEAPSEERIQELKDGAQGCLHCAHFEHMGEGVMMGYCHRWVRRTAFFHDCREFTEAPTAANP